MKGFFHPALRRGRSASAVVGLNGSGKTTFIKLLCRLYDPQEGVITLNGIDIKKYDYEEYMTIFSVVFQDFCVFSFPLGQNVTTSLEYDEQKVWRCLEQAGFAERAEKMPKGSTPRSTRILRRTAWKSPAERRRRSRWPARSTRMRPLSSSTSRRRARPGVGA